MHEKIQKLYEEINFIGYYTSKNNDIHYIDKAKDIREIEDEPGAEEGE